MITTVCKISYGSQTVPPIVPAVQGDTGRAISFEIADFTPPAGATATYFILKPSGEAIYNSATITDNSILCELTAQSLAEAGENRMQVRVLHGEDIVTSFEVILMVRTFLGDDAIESGTEMNIFDQAVEQATEQFQENAEQIVEGVIESIPADYTALTEEVDELNERLSFCNFGYCTSRIDWDTVNKTITIGRGFFIYAGGYKTITEAIVLSYSNFNLLTVLTYNGSTFELRTFQDLVAGDAVALFYVDKMYTPFDYSNIYVNNTLISSENLFNDFGSFVTAINLRIDTLKNEIDTISATVNTLVAEETIYNVNNTQRLNASNDSIWLPKELTIPSDTLIVYIDVYVINGKERTFTISLWNNNTGERYYNEEYTITPTLGSGSYYVRVPINEITIAPTKVGFYSESAFVTVTSDSQRNLLYVASSATSISDASTLTRYAINATIKVVRKEESPILSQEIHVGPGLKFAEIQDAIESVNGNYATIIVHPRETPYNRFSLMRSLGDAYPWSGLANVKHISIIGVDKSKCIIQSNTGNYDTPPAEIATNGIIKNLTFIATHSASDGTETTGSYAVHVDNRPRDENGMKLIFENCDFISYQTASVGLGLYRNQDISFIGCNFKSITDITWKPNENYNPTYMCALGAYFMHTTMGYAGGNMFIRFRNCFLYHSGGNYAMRIADADETQTALLEAIGNTLWAADTQTPGYYTTNNPIMQQPYNHSNNDSLLNA